MVGHQWFQREETRTETWMQRVQRAVIRSDFERPVWFSNEALEEILTIQWQQIVMDNVLYYCR